MAKYDNKKSKQEESNNSKAESNSSQDIKTGSPTPFIDASTAMEAYEESRKWLRPYFDPINEFERIARNKPSDKIPPELPKVTDGTMASIIQEGPKRVVQQPPSGITSCRMYPEYAKIADIVLFKELIPMYNRMGDMLQKSWNMLGKAGAWGRSASYTFYTSTNGKLHTDFVIPYAKDVLSEKGKVFAPDSNIAFLRSWYQARDIKAIINREREFEKNIKGYKSEWDLSALNDFMQGGASSKPADQQTPAEIEKGGDAGGFEVIHAFQVGKGAEFYSFSPRYESGKTFRTKKSKDPRGKMPLDFLYHNIDLSNPMGRGSIELSGGIQNLIDQQMQMFQFLMTMLMGPPLQVWGNVNKASLKFVPNAVWEMGTSPNNSAVKPYEVNNAAITQFPDNYGLLKSQILQLNNANQSAAISAESGNPQFSKTQAGVEAQQNMLGVSDNYLRKQYEAWFQSQSETSINIYFAEMTGKKTLKLEGDELRDILKTPAAKHVDKKGTLTIPYKEISDVAFEFEVDASSSEVKQDADNAEKLSEVYALLSKDPDPNIQEKKVKVLKVLIDEIGAEGTDDLFPELEQKDENGMPISGQPQQPQMTPEMVMQMVQQTVQQALQAQKAEKPQEDPMLQLIKALGIKIQDLPEGARQIILQHLNLGTGETTPAQQNQEDATTKTALDVAKTAHQQTMDTHNAAMSAVQPPPAPGNDQNSAAAGNPGKKDQKQPERTALDAALSPEEKQLAEELLQRGFNEGDVEQAVVMLRQGQPSQQVIQVLGAKYATRQ